MCVLLLYIVIEAKTQALVVSYGGLFVLGVVRAFVLYILRDIGYSCVCGKICFGLGADVH